MTGILKRNKAGPVQNPVGAWCTVHAPNPSCWKWRRIKSLAPNDAPGAFGNLSPPAGVTSGRANHYTTAAIYGLNKEFGNVVFVSDLSLIEAGANFAYLATGVPGSDRQIRYHPSHIQ